MTGHLHNFLKIKIFQYLREVEKLAKKKVSNSYLYQLESDSIKEPSPHVLYTLAEFYGVPYTGIMRLAGYVAPNSKSDKTRGQVPLPLKAFQDLSKEERSRLLEYLEFLRQRKRTT